MKAAPFVGSDFSDADFAAICTLLKGSGGVDLSGYKESCIKRRIAARIRETGHAAPAAYIDLLRNDPEECRRLLNALSIHVSRFYRDPTTFAALRRLLPELTELVRRRDEPLLRCWSAGCAGGEEPYSLAMLLSDSLPAQQPVEIRASDISAEILTQIAENHYDPARLAELSPAERQQWFTPVGADFALRPELRQRVTFFCHDLLAEQPYPAADLILCRYVMIYFAPADQERIVRSFAAALPRGGLLVLGRTEVLRDPAGLFTPVDAAERIYCKVH